jgi:glutathione S-transferase
MGNCAEGVSKSWKVPEEPLTLQYVGMPVRAEAIRLALVVGGINFKDERLPASEWTKEAQKQLPVLSVGARKIGQQKTILRYVGTLAKFEGRHLYPADPFVAAQVDEVLDAFDDLWVLLAPVDTLEDNEQEAVEERGKFLKQGDGEAARKLEKFEEILAKSSSGYVAGEGLTIADLTYFGMLNSLRSGWLKGIDAKMLNSYPKLKQHKEKIASISLVAEYYKDAARSNPLNVPFYEVFRPDS